MLAELKTSLYKLLNHALFKDKRFFLLTGSYAIIIALLYLALPIAIESLIQTITSTALIQPVVIVSIILMSLLSLSAVLTILQKHLIEIYYRSSYARLTSDFFLKVIYADKKNFHQHYTGDLAGRYFELFNVQKSASVLLLDGVLILFQILISIILLSFYHPYLFVLNLICVTVIWLSWALFLKKALKYALLKSTAKFSTFAWLSDVFRMNRFFKSEMTKNYALEKSKELINHYISASKKYWRIALIQNIILMILYLFLTISLFSIGSILVIKGQLSLGQLIAAEIIFTGVLTGVAKLGYYFDLFYNMVCSAHEMRDVFVIETEEINDLMPEMDKIQPGDALLHFKKVSCQDEFGQSFYFDWIFEAGSTNLLYFSDNTCREILIDAILGHIKPEKGWIEFNKISLVHYDQQQMRNHIMVIDNAEIFACTPHEFLVIGAKESNHVDLQAALEMVELHALMHQLPNYLDTPIMSSGYPFSDVQIVLLKIARAIILKPKILILTDVFGKISPHLREKLLKYFSEESSITLLDCSGHLDKTIAYDHFLFLTNQSIFSTPDMSEFEKITANKTL